MILQPHTETLIKNLIDFHSHQKRKKEKKDFPSLSLDHERISLSMFTDSDKSFPTHEGLKNITRLTMPSTSSLRKKS